MTSAKRCEAARTPFDVDAPRGGARGVAGEKPAGDEEKPARRRPGNVLEGLGLRSHERTHRPPTPIHHNIDRRFRREAASRGGIGSKRRH